MHAEKGVGVIESGMMRDLQPPLRVERARLSGGSERAWGWGCVGGIGRFLGERSESGAREAWREAGGQRKEVTAKLAMFWTIHKKTLVVTFWLAHSLLYLAT